MGALLVGFLSQAGYGGSLGVATLTTLLACLLGVPAAFAMATLRVPGANALPYVAAASSIRRRAGSLSNI